MADPWKWGDPLPEETILALVVYLEVNRLIPDWVNLPVVVALGLKEKGLEGLSVREAAERINAGSVVNKVAAKTVERALRGQTVKPSDRTLRAISEALGIRLDLVRQAANPFRQHPDMFYCELPIPSIFHPVPLK